MEIPREFLKYGNKAMTPDWTQVIINDRDLYTGYSYAAIRNRSNYVARTAIENIKTKSKSGEDTHPYLDIISSSPTFSDYQFWYEISTYLDLEGVYYLMAVRGFNGQRYGDIQEFKMLNPYNIKPVYSKDKLEIAGYVEARHGQYREIPKEMIICIKELNPFDEQKPFAMTDAAKEAQFTIKTAGDYTRHSLKHNINAPGLLSTGVLLDEQQFKNFTERVKNHTKGEPIFGNGQGAVNWDSMNIELSKAALKDVNEVSRESMFSVYGTSKTIMGIEQSGVTRETGRVQKDLFTESQILPRIQLIVDALNQDYKNNYSVEFTRTENIIFVDNPLAIDHDSDIKQAEALTKQQELYNTMLNQGYSPQIASDYIMGNIEVDQLGEPTPPVEPIETPDQDTEDDTEQDNHLDHHHAHNELQQSGQVQQQEASLKNVVINVEMRAVAQAIRRVERKTAKNSIKFDQESEVITNSEKKELVSELEMALGMFYGLILTLQGGKTMRNRTSMFALPGFFQLNKDAKKFIKETSKKVAQSHIDTIANDIYEAARQASLAGKGQREIVNEIKNKFNQTISETRAKTIARTESNRAFTQAQYEADLQFMKQNKLQGRVFKQWITRSSNPCQFCQALAAEGMIPLEQPFRNLGDSIRVNDKELSVNFSSLEAGNAHPNCGCAYEIFIDRSDNTIGSIKSDLESQKQELSEALKEIEGIL